MGKEVTKNQIKKLSAADKNSALIALCKQIMAAVDDESIDVDTLTEEAQLYCDSKQRQKILAEALEYVSSHEEYDEEEFFSAAPFSVADTSIDSKTVNVMTLRERIRKGQMDLNPPFQRKVVWSRKRKTQLIESLILGIPLPSFYVAEQENGDWTVVDGLQRTSSIADFVATEKGLILRGCEYLKHLDGCRFDDLPPAIQQKIFESELTFNLIRAETPPEVKFNIFARLNTGGVKLSAQEIRNALYFGPSLDVLARMQDTDAYSDSSLMSVSDKRAADLEILLRFCGWYLREPGKHYVKSGMRDWLNWTQDYMNRMDEDQVADLIESFTLGVMRSVEIFGETAFRKPSPNDRKTPVNKSIFEVFAYHLSRMDDDDYQTMDKELVADRFAQAFARETEYSLAFQKATSSVASVRGRFDNTWELLQDCVD